jgi:hypothetical protein
LLEEYPEWIHTQATTPGRDSIAVMIVGHLAQLLRHDLDRHWATILLEQERLS